MNTATTQKPFAVNVTPIPVAAPEPAAQPIVPVKPPPPPRDSLIQVAKKSLDRFKASPEGEAIGLWLNGIGAVCGYVLPPVLLAGAGYAIGLHHGAAPVAEVGLIGGAIAGAASAIFQNGMDNITTHRRLGSTNARARSFGDVMIYLATPAVVAGGLFAEFVSGSAGLVAAAGAGILGAGLGITTLNVRKRRLSQRGY